MKPNDRKRRPSGRTTLSDVARAADVSPITASRALRGERSVAPELVERVKQAAEQLGYVPDPAARALASQRSNQVPVLVPLLSNALFVDVLEAVHSTLLPQGFQTLIGVTHYSPEQEEQLLRSYLAHRPAGLLLTGFDRTEAARQLIAGSGVPCVHLMELTRAHGVYCVGFSQVDAGHAMTRHLLQRGRQRIAFVAAQLDPRTMQRAEGYRRCLREQGVYDARLELLSPQPSSMRLGGELLQDLLRNHLDVDAVFFCNDDLAQGALLAALRLGIDVPGRLAVAGFNDLSGSDQMVPPLTTVRTPRGTIGEASARMLLGLMRGELPAQHSLDLGFELVVRGSS
ncbi:MAG: LacI family DNA-binding transcriptional regulator [Hydrogenophaga sp.]|uniref:LacI family DNA-binding transcriptional regulator n=1 Tax=Hydrogenophaga sp. TaxID=1904254 RepID=UPI00271B7AC5|nr:LacI family DNA-binding transcriptional regulator [Hydrogenophaga sp.]MDO9572138.1 LacI family DNA-binding transcriptional regulator [Hydrogenophaga sp.]MDP3374994.1 LacI family DNA-binding transcriptional regulator [Hydrogenophaga sp.]